MIKVTRLNGKEFVVNTELIKTIEATPDTVIRLVSEDKFVVTESVDEIIRRVVDYRRACFGTVNDLSLQESQDDHIPEEKEESL